MTILLPRSAASAQHPESAASGAFATSNWLVSNTTAGGPVFLKIWPDVLLFYSFIYIVSIVGLATRVSPAV